MTKIKWSYIAIAFTLILSSFAYFLPAKETAAAATNKTATVNLKSGVNVRAAAKPNAKVLGVLKNGTKVTVYDDNIYAWTTIRYNNKKAYVATKYLKFPKAASVATKNYNNVRDLVYPQVTVANKTAQANINKVLTAHAIASYKEYSKVKGSKNKAYTTTYKVKFNQESKLSIVVYDYSYTGGAHGLTAVTTFNFNTTTGKQIKLNNVFTAKNDFVKVQKFVYNYMTKEQPKKFYVKKLSEVKINNNSSFYFTTDGIYLIFQQYEVAPYAAGNPVISIPNYLY